jgi:hypothetical protein
MLQLGGLMLWSIAIGAPGVVRVRKPGERGGSNPTPRMNADGRGLGLKGIRETRMSTNEKDTLGGIEVLHSRQRRPLLQDDELRRADCPARGFDNSGVTRRKSFKSGVEGGVPGAKSRDSHKRENSLKQHGHYGHSRDLSTPPHSPSQAQGSSESLKMTAGGERVPASGDQKSDFLPPNTEERRREQEQAGEKGASVLKSTELHNCAQDGEEMRPTIMKAMPAEPTSPLQGLKPDASSTLAGLESFPDTSLEEQTASAGLKSCPETSQDGTNDVDEGCGFGSDIS